MSIYSVPTASSTTATSSGATSGNTSAGKLHSSNSTGSSYDKSKFDKFNLSPEDTDMELDEFPQESVQIEELPVDTEETKHSEATPTTSTTGATGTTGDGTWPNDSTSNRSSTGSFGACQPQASNGPLSTNVLVVFLSDKTNQLDVDRLAEQYGATVLKPRDPTATSVAELEYAVLSTGCGRGQGLIIIPGTPSAEQAQAALRLANTTTLYLRVDTAGSREVSPTPPAESVFVSSNRFRSILLPQEPGLKQDPLLFAQIAIDNPHLDILEIR